MNISRRDFIFLALTALAGSAKATEAQAAPDAAAPSSAIVYDSFGNPLGDRGIALVDWDGYIANPAIKLAVGAGPGLSLPATVTLATSVTYLYFDSPSTVGPHGSRKIFQLTDPDQPVHFYLTNFPDRNGGDKDTYLWIEVTDFDGASHVSRVNIHVFDQDSSRDNDFDVAVNYSYDKTGFFADPVKQGIVQKAADDWAYFIDDMHVDPVAVGAEQIAIYPPTTDWSKPPTMPNTVGFTGYLLEVYGVTSSLHKTAGDASDQSFQTSGGAPLPLRRSGHVAVDTGGNGNVLGWVLMTDESQWWSTDNRPSHEGDLYSILHHEMGHAIFFSGNNTDELKQRKDGAFTSDELMSYHGRYPKVDAGNHLAGEFDDDSQMPAFGNEMNGSFPQGRWVITKLDILCAEAIGYKVRKPFNLGIHPTIALDGHVNSQYDLYLSAHGGIPWYSWSIATGSLPPGLQIDPDTGKISGAPTAAGNYRFVVQVQDFSQRRDKAQLPLTISITGATA